MHSGHQALFRKVVQTAGSRYLVPTVLTFNPHPQTYFGQKAAYAHISPIRNNLGWMAHYGIEQAAVLTFDKGFSRQTPEFFANDILVRRLRARHVWVGDDFRFGHGRTGDFAMLRSLGTRYGFEVERMPQVTQGGQRIASSRIRQHLQHGEVDAALALLGHPLIYTAHVVHGKKLGRTLGYPTLNMRLPIPHSALTGILAVWVHGLESSPLPGVASLGRRPTVENEGALLLETHVFDWSADVYGKNPSIEVVGYLRPELHFACLADLRAQMAQDAMQARILLQTRTPLFQPGLIR